MKAVTQQRYGDPSVLEIMETVRPTAGPKEVVVELHASVVTQGDRRLREADFPGITMIPARLMLGLTGPRSAVSGSMFSGRIIEVGDEATQWKVGDEVFGGGMHGAWAEHLVVTADSGIAIKPTCLSFEEAAAIPYGAGTALAFLRDLAEVQPGERVAIVGAGGGVGRYAVQLAKYLGGQVTAICGADDAALVRSLGADDVLDYRSADFWSLDRQWDVVFDTSGRVGFSACRAALAETGRYLTVEISAGLLFQMAWTAWGTGPQVKFTVALESAESMRDVASLAESGAIRPTVAKSYALDDIVAAHDCLQSERPSGEVVVAIR